MNPAIEAIVAEFFPDHGNGNSFSYVSLTPVQLRAALTRAAEGRWVSLQHQIYLDLCDTDWPDDWAKDGCTPENYKAARIVALIKGGGWIPVRGDAPHYMPRDDKPVLIAYKSQLHHRAELARYSGGLWRFMTKDETRLQERVTHWQSLPTPPTD